MNKKTGLILLAVVVALGAGFLISKQSGNDKPASQSQSTNSSDSGTKSGGATLDLTGQQLTALPASALNRTDVTTLNVSNNQLNTLPSDISKMVNLEVLNIENNRIESLPSELVQLKKLREIHANNNRLTSLPDVLSEMTGLKLLDISGNNIPSSQVDQLKAKLSNTDIKN